MNNGPQKPLWISDEDVQRVLTHDRTYKAVKDALVCHASGCFDQPFKPYVRPGGREGERLQGRLIVMPGYVGDPVNVLGTKLIAGFPSNLERGLPRASGVVVLHSLETGFPEAVIDCRTLSARRTASVACLCIDHLASKGRRRVGIIGAGPVATETLAALLTRDRNIESISLFDIRAERCDQLVDLGQKISDVEIRASSSAEECTRNSNVLITATTGAKEYVQLDWLSGDWLVVPLSLDDCDPSVLLSADKLICDDFDQGNRENKLLHRLIGSGRLDRGDLYAELGEILAGKKPGREADETIYANCMGMAIEDLASAAVTYRSIVRKE